MQYKSYGSLACSAHETFYVSLARLSGFSGFLWTSSSFHYFGVSQNKLGGMVCAIENLASKFVAFIKNSFKIENLVQLHIWGGKDYQIEQFLVQQRQPFLLQKVYEPQCRSEIARFIHTFCLETFYLFLARHSGFLGFLRAPISSFVH